MRTNNDLYHSDDYREFCDEQGIDYTDEDSLIMYRDALEDMHNPHA